MEKAKTVDGFLDIKRDSKGTYYSIINYLRLTDKEDFRKKIFKKPLAAIPILLLCFHFFLYCTNGHCLSKSSLQFMLLSLFTSCNP